MSDYTIMVVWVMKTFLDSSSVYSCHLFLISSASVRSIQFLSFICMKCSLGISNFLEEISSLSHSIVFLYFFAPITKEGFLSLPAILWNSAFKWVYLYFSPLPFTSLLFSAIYNASSDKHFSFLHFFFLEIILITVSCTILQTLSILLQALYQI